jgi:leucyl aminopeptidase
VEFALIEGTDGSPVPIEGLEETTLEAWLDRADPRETAWVRATGFTAKPGSTCLVPGDAGGLSRVLLGLETDGSVPGRGIWAYAGLPKSLPAGAYTLVGLDGQAATEACLGWALGTYAFGRFKKVEPVEARLAWPVSADRGEVLRVATGVSLTRDLINRPANDLGPAELADAARELAERHGAAFSVIVGDDLLEQNYPAVHAVGRASSRPPRLIDIRWGDESHPKVTLVGKGVVFDSGGLDLKPAGGMLTMKKDMGGSAQVLGLASIIMDAKLPVRLRVMVPAVENAVSGDAFRPLDVLQTRKGITIEVGNTDAEGRLILADALAEADSEKPEMILEYATLTGAARIALGTELPAMFSNDDRLANDVLEGGVEAGDPLWRMPLWKPYAAMLKSPVADTSSTGSGGFGGAITAALFLEKFVSRTTPWMHFDLMAWNLSSKPGRPEGGEAMGMRAAWAMLKRRYGNS